jgi:methionyl-tRNA formyltransferase
VNGIRGRGSVINLAKKADIPIFFVSDINSDTTLKSLLPADLALAINFDQILHQPFLSKFRGGILNLHASCLPRDKGISPVLWAFARGDKEIWATIYKMDGGLDSGPIFEQFSLPVVEDETVFSVYEGVCVEGGKRLSRTVELFFSDKLRDPIDQEPPGSAIALSWPDANFDKMLKKNQRKLFRLTDIFRALRMR